MMVEDLAYLSEAPRKDRPLVESITIKSTLS
jgi:hypothetical protein